MREGGRRGRGERARVVAGQGPAPGWEPWGSRRAVAAWPSRPLAGDRAQLARGEADPCAAHSGSAPAAPALPAPPPSLLPSSILPQLRRAGGGHRRGGPAAPAARPSLGIPAGGAGQGEGRGSAPPGFTSIGDAASAAPTPIPGGRRRAFLR